MAGDKKRSIIRIRVLCDSLYVEETATRIGELLQKDGFEIIEQTPAYPNRPPEENESRVYLMVRKERE